MNNVITILMDSVYSKCIGSGVTKESSTPYIDKLAAEGFFAPNVYSFGPYTDAATKGLYCGEPTLDDYGFYYCINGSNTNHFKAFKERGYETYGFYYPYYLLSSRVEKYIDHSIYISGFLYESVWNGKLKHYSEIRRQEQLNTFDYRVLEKCLDMVFDCWQQFYRNLKNQELSDIIVSRLKSPMSDSKKGEDALTEEYKKYRGNKRQYIDLVLEEGMNHPLARINDYDFNRHINRTFLENEVYGRNSKFFEDVYRINLKYNRINNSFQYGRFLSDGIKFIRSRNKEDIRYEINYGMLMSSTKMMKKRSFKNEWQLEASAGKQVDSLIKILDNRNSDKPFYASLHVEEPHHNIAFFSYDMDDPRRVNDELQYLSPLVYNCGENFSGNLVYQLSLRYVDYTVKRLCTHLEKTGLLDKCIIMLVADHGSSYTFNPIRDTVTNNFYDENYHIPLIIWEKGIKDSSAGLYKGLYTSADVFPTLLDFAGQYCEAEFSGKSILKNKEGREVVITEYTGPGCPDLTRREIWISGRTKKYTVAFQVRLDGDIDAIEPVQIFNKVDDPKELNNIVSTDIVKDEEVSLIINKIKKRLVEIRCNRDKIVEDFDNFNVINS